MTEAAARRAAVALLAVCSLCTACSDDGGATGATAQTGTGGATGTGGSGQGGSGGASYDPPDWSCIGNVDPYGLPRAETSVFTRTIVDFLTDEPIAGLEALACAKDDQDCTTPLDSSTTDDDGVVTLMLPLGTTGFDGHLELSGPDVSWLSFSSRPIIGDVEYEETIVTNSEMTTLAALVSSTLQPDKGHVVIGVNDCPRGGDPVGATVATTGVTRDTLVVYLEEGLPSAEAMETDPSGIAGIINVEAGDVTVSGAYQGTEFGSHPIFLRAGTQSSIGLSPMP